MEHIFTHFEEYLIIALLLSLFFKEALVEFINAKLGIKKKEEKTPEWGEKLTQYANHDTTERLEKLLRMEESEHEKYDEFRKTLINIDKTLLEFKEYGIRVRKE